MATSITSCMPCAAAPVAPQKPKQQPAGAACGTPPAPADTGYDASGAGCADGGKWVPEPNAAAGGETPPEPVGAPDGPPPSDAPESATAGGHVEGGPASSLEDWPTWEQYFTDLGVNPDEIAKIASAPLDDHGLAKVYKELHQGIVASGNVPGRIDPSTIDPAVLDTVSGRGPGTSAWSPAWEQRFLELGVPSEFVGMIAEQSAATGADDAKLQSVYDQLAQAKASSAGMPTGAALDPMAAPGAPAPAPGAADPAAAAAASQEPGWSPEVEQAFRKLGMPKEVVDIYAQSGAPLSGLEAAYKHAAGRLQDFEDRGWMEKFEAEGVDPVDTWSLILGPQPATDEELQAQLDAAKNANMGLPAKGAQLATSLFPGGRLAQYVMGKEAVSGEDIDRGSPLEIGMAALSGVAAFAAFRGAKNVFAGIGARSGGYAELGSVSETMAKLGLPSAGAEAAEQAAVGATGTWGTTQKIMAAIPGTSLHREVVGMGHVEAAAKAFNNGGAATLAKGPDGALQVSTLAQLFDEARTGATSFQGGANAYLGQIRKSAPMAASVAKDGSDVVRVAKGLGIGDGRSQLAAMLEVGGTKLGQDPTWLRSAPQIADDIATRSSADLASLGQVMAGNAVRDLGGIGSDGMRAVSYLNGLQRGSSPSWYQELAARTAGEIGSGAAATDSAAAASPMMARIDDIVATRQAAGERAAAKVVDAMAARRAAGGAAAAEPATAASSASPLELAVNARGEASTPAGLVVPSYASPVTGDLHVASSMDEATKYAAMDRRIRAGA